MIIARIMQGVGASMFAISFGIIRDKFEPEKLAVAQGIFSSMFSAGAVIGVAIGGNTLTSSLVTSKDRILFFLMSTAM